MKIKRKRKLFRQFLASYICILLIPLLIGAIYYSTSVKIIEKKTLENNLSSLEQTKDIIDNQLRQIEDTSVHLTKNSDIVKLMMIQGNVEGNQIYYLNSAWKNLNLIKFTNRFMKDFFIVSNNNDIILSPDTTYRKNIFYGNIIEFENMDNNEFEKKYLLTNYFKTYFPTSRMTYNKNNYNMILYAHSEIKGISDEVLFTFLALIDENELINYLDSIDLGEQGFAYICNGEGDIMAITNSTPVLDEDLKSLYKNIENESNSFFENDNQLVSFTQSSFNDWVYVAVQPKNLVLKDLIRIRTTMYAIVLMALIVGILSALLLTYINTAPIEKLVKILKGDSNYSSSEWKSEYEYLGSEIKRIIRDDTNLRDKLKAQIPFLQADFIRKLIMGEIIKNDEIKDNMKQAELEIIGEEYVVLQANIINYYGKYNKVILDELHSLKIILSGEIIRYTQNSYVTDIDESKLAILIIFDKNKLCRKNEYINDMVSSICKMMQSKYGVRIVFSGGNLYSQLSDIFYSYRESKQVLDFLTIEDGKYIYWYSDLKVTGDIYYYPLDIEYRILNLIKAGDLDETIKLTDIVYFENFENRSISGQTISSLISEFKGTVIKALEEIAPDNNNLKDEILEIIGTDYKIEDIKKKYEYIKTGIENICDYVNSKKQSKNVKLKEKLENYIRNNYSDQDLSLCKVASEFNLSEIYLSSFFKEQTGENFSEYVERLRMEKACELLQEGKMTLEKISLIVGYNSAHVFRRAFKRRFGIKPSLYKT